jgi:hypothetical protein
MTRIGRCVYAAFVGEQPAVDLVGDAASTQTERLGLGITSLHPSLYVRLSQRKARH